MIGEKVIHLTPIKETTEDYDEIEKRIKAEFKKRFYYPLLEAAGINRLKLHNAKTDKDAVKRAVESGRITFYRGTFRGKFSAQVSKELKKLGAVWDKKSGTFKIQVSVLPEEIRRSIGASVGAFQRTLDRIDKALRQISPAEIAGSIKTSSLFDLSLFKVDRKVEKTLQGITVLPTLTAERRKKIADEWQNNMNLWIKDFAAEEIVELRERVHAHALSGGRYEQLLGVIQKSYGVTANKAKFLARQETSLLMTKFKETRYTEANILEYTWGTVAGSPKHPVRPSHKILEGKTFKWSDPPITTAPNEPARRNNPGEDYNCRCFARPVVRVKG